MPRRPRFTTRFSRARDLAVNYLTGPLRLFKPRTLFLLGFGALVVITTPLLLNSYSSSLATNYREGEVIRGSIVARGDITAIDVAETERRRDAASRATRPVFNFDTTRGETSSRSFQSAWDDLNLQLQQKESETDLTWNGEGGATVARALSEHKLTDYDLKILTSLIRELGDKYIYDDAEADRLEQEIVLVDVRNPSGQMVMPEPRTRMLPLSAARREMEMRIFGLQRWTPEQKAALVSAIVPLLRPNVVLDQTATATAREAAANKIQQVPISLKRNQVIAREGDTVTAATLSQLT